MIIYVSSTISVAIRMMAVYYDSIPINLEGAAWILLAWNDYLVALVSLRSNFNFTFLVGLQSFFQQNATNWGLVMAVAVAVAVMMMLPPVILFAALNRYFSVGGIGGSLAGQ